MNDAKEPQYKWIKCPDCNGQGHWNYGTHIKICKRCSNEGEIKVPIDYREKR